MELDVIIIKNGSGAIRKTYRSTDEVTLVQFRVLGRPCAILGQ
jgi:hypothetical protein